MGSTRDVNILYLNWSQDEYFYLFNFCPWSFNYLLAIIEHQLAFEFFGSTSYNNRFFTWFASKLSKIRWTILRSYFCLYCHLVMKTLYLVMLLLLFGMKLLLQKFPWLLSLQKWWVALFLSSQLYSFNSKNLILRLFCYSGKVFWLVEV